MKLSNDDKIPADINKTYEAPYKARARNDTKPLTKDRLFEVSAKSVYKPLTLHEVNQILKNQEKAKQFHTLQEAIKNADECDPYKCQDAIRTMKIFLDINP